MLHKIESLKEISFFILIDELMKVILKSTFMDYPNS